MADTLHANPAGQAAPGAGVCTIPPDLARQLDSLLNDRDKLRTLRERHHAFLVHALQSMPGTEVVRHRAACAWSCIEAADLASDAALRLALDALRCCGVVVDVPDTDEAAADDGAADTEGDKP